jgi:CDP-paratose 2-epimerase
MNAPAPAITGLRPVLVTGGAGFIGSNLADRLALEGHHVAILDALRRPGTERNIAWLKARHPSRITLAQADINNRTAVGELVRDAAAIFHLAAQVAVTTSIEEPAEDFATNVGGTFGLLEAARRQDRPLPFLFASTNKVYGDLGDIALARENDAYVPLDTQIRQNGVSEACPLSFHTPYGCSKGAADQYVLDYARSYRLPAAVMRMSCIYGPRQMGTEDQGWVAHFLIRALQGKPISIYGDGCQVRDILYVDDAVEAYLAAWRRIGDVTGRAFNLGGGPSNAVSLRTLIVFIEEQLGRPVETVHAQWRPGDQRYYVSDRRRAERELGLARPLAWREGVTRLLAWLKQGRMADQAQSATIVERARTEVAG